MTQSPVSFSFEGGLDMVTPVEKMPPGRAIDCLNYEPTAAGYRRLRGFERFDGRLAPSDSDVPATITARRAAITAVPGTGPVRAIFPSPYLGGFGAGPVAAIRDSGGSAHLYWSSQDGWIAQAIGYSFEFDQGGIDGVELVAGANYDDVSGGGGDVATLLRFAVTSGSWSEGNAVGYGSLVEDPAGWSNGDYIYVNFPAGALRVCRITSAPAAPVMPEGGTYSWIRHNFYGAQNSTATYFSTSVGRAFEFGKSGIFSYVAEIRTGMADDRPTRIAEHRNSLFLAFRGGSVQHSAPGEPLTWNVILGAGEIGIGDDVTDFLGLPDALGILGTETVNILYGNNSSDYQLTLLSHEAGALPHTAQRIGRALYMDNRGVRSLDATQAFGNFTMGTISILAAPFLETKRRESIEPVASWVSRTGDQYWVAYEDGTGFVIYMGKKYPEIMLFDLEITVTCAASVEDDGVERIFLGASDGFVYEMNKGTSFDGAPIEHYVRLPYNAFGKPESDKQAHYISAELETPGDELALNVTLDFNDGDESTGVIPMDVDLGAVQPSTGLRKGRATANPDGMGKNVSAMFSGEAADEQEHTLRSVTYRLTVMNTLA